ncbi:alpha-1,6-mannosyltransferase Och1 [Polyrhizophydium stewartii]|uniref:Alpha-1,6-mannosyltransferase Och1 n=1 Tax=Polyrhizophydium stewartii TaxID=2732419 RepID=A0ABR4N4G9_9FUNG
MPAIAAPQRGHTAARGRARTVVVFPSLRTGSGSTTDKAASGPRRSWVRVSCTRNQSMRILFAGAAAVVCVLMYGTLFVVLGSLSSVGRGSSPRPVSRTSVPAHRLLRDEDIPASHARSYPMLSLSADMSANVTSRVLPLAEAAAFGTPHTLPIPRIIHQSWRDGNLPPETMPNVEEFQALSGFTHLLWTDADLSDFVRKYHPSIHSLYLALPKPILRVDLARYLLLLTFGGVYSDIDTRPLRRPDNWADQHASAAHLIVGIEADTLEYDWPVWFARSLQICQWTIASAPGHRVLHRAASAAVHALREEMTDGNADIDVIETTGPALWTDVVLADLAERGIGRKDLRDLDHTVAVGDVVVVPITGFSPGRESMGSRNMRDPEARVFHSFMGSWKDEAGPRVWWR